MKNYYAQIKAQNNTLVATNFADIYFDDASGTEEKQYVFLKHNNLAERFASLNDDDTFIIAETGFGIGLSFLLTLKLWQQTVKSNAKLYFISFEKYPLSPHDLNTTLANFSSLSQQQEQLIKQYYLLLQTTHRLIFESNVYLNLVIGDITTTIATQNFAADAWFLDGFSPSKNPAMWQESVIAHIARLSKPGTTFSTYTANGAVKRSLIKHGFTVSKVPGINKREMLIGHYPPLINNEVHANKISPKQSNKSVIIVGGGISGAATAYSLAKRGYSVTVHEKNLALAQEASGNYQGILYNNFSAAYSPHMELSYTGYRYSNWLIKELLLSGQDYEQSGVVQLAYDDRQLMRQKRMFNIRNHPSFPQDFCYEVSHHEIEQLANIPINCDNGIYFPYGLWLNPPSLVAALVSHPNIQIVTDSHITQLLQTQNNEWIVKNTHGNCYSAAHVVLCNSHLLNQFIPTQTINFYTIRGQITVVQNTLNLKSVICSNGYITPNRGSYYTLGATFKDGDSNTDVRVAEHYENIARMAPFIPSLNSQVADINSLIGKASLRARRDNYLPLVGPVNTSRGLYANALHGSKGLLFAPFCGEIIADYITGAVPAISNTLKKLLYQTYE